MFGEIELADVITVMGINTLVLYFVLNWKMNDVLRELKADIWAAQTDCSYSEEED